MVKGPVGPHLFRASMDASDYDRPSSNIHVALDGPPVNDSSLLYNSASKLDPVRRDTPIPNKVTEAPQPQQSHLSTELPALNEIEPRCWTPRDVTDWMRSLDFDDSIMETFFVNDISGSILLELQTEDLKELGIKSFGKRHRLMNSIQSLRDSAALFIPSSRTSRSNESTREAQSTPQTTRSMSSSDYLSSSTTDNDGNHSRPKNNRRRRYKPDAGARKPGDLGPGDSISIVAIEQMLPRLHSCSKGEDCRKWQKQQAKLARLAKDLPANSFGGTAILTGDPGNPATAPNLVKSPKSDVTPSLIASSDVMGPVPAPGYRISPAKLNEVQPRDPQENVRNFLNFQSLGQLQPVNDPATPPRELLPSPESDSPGPIKAAPSLADNLRHLPKLRIPSRHESVDSSIASPNLSAQRTATPSMGRRKHHFYQQDQTPVQFERQQYAYGTYASPGDYYRNDPHYGQETPVSEVDVPMTAFPCGPVARDVSQSVPPNMLFGADRHVVADPVIRPASTKAENQRRNMPAQNSERLGRLDEGYVMSPIETPEDLERTPRVGYGRNRQGCSIRRTPNGVTHSGWMKKRKTTRLLRHEWEDHHFTLRGTQLAMHADEESSYRNSKALEHIDVDDYAVACSSLASTTKLTAAFKKTVLKRKDNARDESAFSFSLIPAPGNGTAPLDRKALFLSNGKSHHFAVKTRDERIDWMRELMLAKALKRGRESGAALNINGNVF